MSEVWNSDPEPEEVRISLLGWGRVLCRGLLLGGLIFGGLVLLFAVRLVERPVWGLHRPWTPFITQFVCRNGLRILGIGYQHRGEQMRDKGAVVANHASWLDIFTLNARKRVYFVSKSEVAGWFGIGWLARATGTVFIRRHARDAKAQQHIFEGRLKVGHKLLFFPEGTSTDGLRVLPFKSTLFAAFLIPELRNVLSIQPDTVLYQAPQGETAHFYGWWDDMALAPHLLKTLAARRQGSVEVIYHPPVRVAEFGDRKALARYCEVAVRSGLPALSRQQPTAG